MFIATFLLALGFFVATHWLWQKARDWKAKSALLAISFLAALPGMLYSLYYLHLFDNWATFYQFRSLPCSELAASGAGLLAGCLTAAIPRWKKQLRPLIIAGLLFGLMLPYIKPLLTPMPLEKFSETWRKSVCLQSTQSSCGLASTVTLLKRFGIKTTECELARRCHTSSSGTENWYIARVFRNYGFGVKFHTRMPEKGIPTPSIAGVRCGGIGHFIPIIAETEKSYLTGDPLVGPEELTKDKIFKRYEFTGFFLEIIPPHSQPPLAP